MNAFNDYLVFTYFTLSFGLSYINFLELFVGWDFNEFMKLKYALLCSSNTFILFALWSVFLETNYINSIHELAIIKIEQPLINSYGRK